MSPESVKKVKHYERHLLAAAAYVRSVKSPVRKASRIWDLAYVELRDLEDLRPGGGFGQLLSAPKRRGVRKQ